MRLNIYNSLLGLCVASAAVSCSNELVDADFNHVGGEETDMISFVVADDLTRGGSFGNRPGTSTRGAATTDKNITDFPFAVYGDMAINSSANNPSVIFDGTQVNYENGDWKYSKLQYWISDRTYSFTAIHPATAIPNLDYSDGTLSFQYTLPSKIEDNVDILTASHRRKYDGSTGSPVSFVFQHILSRINFVLNIDKTIGDKNQVVIEEISLQNISNSGSYSLTPAPLTSGTSTYDASGDSGWKNLSAPNATLFELSYPQGLTLNGGEKVDFFPASGEDAKMLCVIPQELTSDITLYVKYHSVENGKDQTSKEVYGNLYSVALTTHNARWKAGESYTYAMTIGAEGKILFTMPDVENWKDAEGGNYVITD